MNAQEIKKPAIYKRFSTDQQDMKTQNLQIEEFLIREKLNPDDCLIYIDEGFTGRDGKRPGYINLLKSITEDKISFVLAQRMDRIARSSLELQQFLKLCQDHKTEIVFVRMQIDTRNPAGKLLFDIMAAFAEFEHSIISERLAEGRRRARLDGISCSRPEKEVDIYKVIELHDVKGLSFSSIKKMLYNDQNNSEKNITVATIIRRYKKHKHG